MTNFIHRVNINLSIFPNIKFNTPWDLGNRMTGIKTWQIYNNCIQNYRIFCIHRIHVSFFIYIMNLYNFLIICSVLIAEYGLYLRIRNIIFWLQSFSKKELCFLESIQNNSNHDWKMFQDAFVNVTRIWEECSVSI